MTEPSISANNTTNPGGGSGGGGGGSGGGSGGGGSSIHGPLPTIGSVTMSMVSSATTSMVGPYTLYTGGVATPTIRLAGVNVGNRIRLYAWDAMSGGPYVCTTVSAEQTAAATTEDLILSPALANGYWIFVPVLDDGSGTNTGCPSITDVTGQLVPFVYYNLTIVATAPTSITLVSPTSATSYNTRPTVQVGGLSSGDTVAVYADASCSTAVGSATATGVTSDVTLSTSLNTGAATLYAKRTTSAGTASGCSTVSLNYTVQAPTGGLPNLAGVAMTMNGVGAPANYGGGLFVYSGAVAKPSLGITGVNVGNRIKIYQWEGAGPYTCTNLVAETGADATTETIQVTTATTGTVVYVPVIDDGSGSDTGCPNVGTFPAFPYAYYQYTPPVSAPTALARQSPTTATGRDDTPTIRISGVVSGNTIKLFTDSSCTTQVASGVATGTTIDLTTSSLATGSYTFYANAADTSSTSACSTASVSYTFDTTISAPTGLTLSYPSASPYNVSQPTIHVAGVTSGDTVNIFSDSSCTTKVATGTASSTTIDLWFGDYPTTLSDGSYTFYAQAANGSYSSSCSTANVSYTMYSTIPAPSGLSLISPASSPGTDLHPVIRISGVHSGDTVFLYHDSSCNSAINSELATGTSVDITDYSISGIGSYDYYATRYDGLVSSPCSTAHVVYAVNIPPTSVTLVSPASSPGSVLRPVIYVSPVAPSSEIAKLYYDSSCTSLVGSATNTGIYTTYAAISPSSDLADGTYDFYATLTTADGSYTTGCSSSHAQYVLDSLATVSFSSIHKRALEGSGSTSFTVTMSRAKGSNVTVYYDLIGSTATYNTHHNLTSGSVVIPAGQTSATISFNLLENALADGEKFVQINLNRTSKSTVSVGLVNSARQYIVDNESSYATVVDVSFGASHSCVVLSNGQLKCWGENTNGQIGDGTTTNRNTPTVIDSGTSYIRVSAGYKHTCAITTTGVLKCWGYNTFGQIGNSSTVDVLSPLVIDGGTGYSDIAAGALNTCGVTTLAGLKCWGYNPYLGDGSANGSNTTSPIYIPTIYNFTKVVTSNTNLSYSHNTCAISTAQEMFCWGQNSNYHQLGMLGDGTYNDKNSPVKVLSGTYTDVAIGDGGICFLSTTGDVTCRGYQLTSSWSADVIVDSGVQYSSISLSGNKFCGITSAGLVRCFGGLQLGTGTNLSAPLAYSTGYVALPIAGNETFKKIATAGGAGGNLEAACGITTNDYLLCWGSMGYLKYNNSTSRYDYSAGLINCTESLFRYSTPVTVDLEKTYSAISLGVGAVGGGGCAISSGVLYCWGSAGNSSGTVYGTVGDGTDYYRNSPIAIDSLNTYSYVSRGGGGRRCAITTSGVLKCWGIGFVGDGSTTFYSSPIVIDSGVTYLSVETGSSASCGITSSGDLKCWGGNYFYEVGDGLGVQVLSPKIIDAGQTYTKLSMQANSVCGITSGGVLKCWGYNNAGQLGDGTTSSIATPTVIDSGTLYKDVSVGYSVSCGITTTDVLKCWGSGAIGDGSYGGPFSPTVIDSGVLYSSVSTGVIACAIEKTTGVLKCWGANAQSEVGDGTNLSKLTPTVIDSGVSYSKISAGDSYCGITLAGSLKCWGLTSLLPSGQNIYLPFFRTLGLEGP